MLGWIEVNWLKIIQFTDLAQQADSILVEIELSIVQLFVYYPTDKEVSCRDGLIQLRVLSKVFKHFAFLRTLILCFGTNT